MAEEFNDILKCPLLVSVTEPFLLPPAASPQLSVFYNVRNEEQNRGRSHGTGHHEPFYLHVGLEDVDLNSAHLFICTR